MKTKKIIPGIMIMLACLSLNEAMGQLGLAWVWSGTNIYNANTGNVGIGTSNIGLYKLLVEGGPPSAFSPQIEVWNGNPNIGGSRMLADVNDNGGFNGIFNLYLNGNRRISLLASGNSFLNGGNVGIGNSTPSTLLYVAKNMTEPTITVRNLGGSGGATYSMVDDASGANWKFKATAAGGFKIRDHASGFDVFTIEQNAAANAIYIKQGGSVGIWTTNPSPFAFGVNAPNGVSGFTGQIEIYNGDFNIPGSSWMLADINDDGGFNGNGVLHLYKNGNYTIKLVASGNSHFNGGSVGFGTTTPDNSALVDITSTTQGFLPPRMTQAQIGYISSPADGLIVYCTTDSKFYAYVASGNAWMEILFGSGTISPFSCGSSIIINHVAGAVAPVTKTVTYGTVTNIPGETSKCWITSNLGADNQASAVNDGTEPSAGWYWQFNRMQGYKHDGTTRTPNTTWITSISENSDWTSANDPCALELGDGWRIPTYTEWTNVDAIGGWTNWTGPWSSGLKLHAAGDLGFTDGLRRWCGEGGYYWSSKQIDDSGAWSLGFNNVACLVSGYSKAYGFSLRCLR